MPHSDIRALDALYSAMLFEELQAYQVADRLVELFRQGMLPLGPEGAARGLLADWERVRLSPSAAGTDGGVANREFHELWQRFIAAVSDLARPQPLTDAARALAASLSSHGAPDAAVAEQMRSQIDLLRRLLADPEIRSACEARDMGPLIERVAAVERGVRATLGRLLAASDAFTTISRPAQETIARDTGRVAELLADIDFPHFVASLIAGTFETMVSASIEQMEAYGKLVAAVAAAVDEFVAGNVTENEMRDHLVDQFPEWLGPADGHSLANVLTKGIQRIVTVTFPRHHGYSF